MIPDRQWLLDNGWLSTRTDDGEPLFLQSIQLFVPSGAATNYRYNVETSFSYYNRAALLNGKEYELPKSVMDTEYTENGAACTTPFQNAYNTPSCNTAYESVMILILGYSATF